MHKDKKEEREEIQEEVEQSSAVLEEKISELEEKILRLLADSENQKKRAAKEKEDTLKFCIFDFAKDVLTIRDNLKLALTSCKEESNPIFEGVKLTLAILDKVLAKYEITLIESLNQPFNPHFHQAMFEVPNDTVESGTIVEVVQDGFLIHDRLLRPALVGVSKT